MQIKRTYQRGNRHQSLIRKGKSKEEPTGEEFVMATAQCSTFERGGRLDQIAHVPVAVGDKRSPTLTSPANERRSFRVARRALPPPCVHLAELRQENLLKVEWLHTILQP